MESHSGSTHSISASTHSTSGSMHSVSGSTHTQHLRFHAQHLRFYTHTGSHVPCTASQIAHTGSQVPHRESVSLQNPSFHTDTQLLRYKCVENLQSSKGVINTDVGTMTGIKHLLYLEAECIFMCSRTDS